MSIPFYQLPRGGDDEDYSNEYYPEDDYYDDYEGDYGDEASDNWQGGSRSNRGGWGGFGGPPQNFGNMGAGGFSWGRGFGPDGPPTRNNGPRNAAIRYLMGCGVPRDQLRKFPNELLSLIQPDYCGVCNTPLNNYFMSRSHYVSKFHYKNEQKWLYPRSSKGPSRKYEAPLKSRDLYCELCDVHITSKSHADSHYGGKPHRAIVEGRKEPKNSALLNKNMAGRWEQLIRREKRFLKNVKEVVKVEKPVVQEKVITPELYCEICKAPVTCSEQMTIHLNGKRHLAKEKRHILNMMQGKTDEENQKEDEEANEGDGEGDEAGNDAETDKDQEGDKKTEDEGEGGGDQFDWGNGSGAWEDEPEKKAEN